MATLFMDLSFPFVLDLHRAKVKAEMRKDTQALTNLEQNYPELFTADFQDFIEGIQLTAKLLDDTHDQNFSSLFNFTEDTSSNGSLH